MTSNRRVLQTRGLDGWTTATEELSTARRAAAGDRSAFERLMRRYNRRLYRLARASLRDDTQAKDALQDAYLCAYRSIGQFRGASTLSTWLSRLVLNECNAHRRRSTRRQNIFPMVSSDSNMNVVARIPDSGEAPDHSVARSQMRTVLEHKVDELPESLRVVFVLRSVEELSVEETAASLAIPQQTVRTRYFRAKAMLRESLAKEVELMKAVIL